MVSGLGNGGIPLLLSPAVRDDWLSLTGDVKVGTVWALSAGVGQSPFLRLCYYLLGCKASLNSLINNTDSN